MTSNDLFGLAASYGYAIGLIALAEMLHRALGVEQDLTRKLVHIGAGMWVFGALALFDNWQWGVLPFATFILGNYLFHRYRIFKAMDADDSTLGTVYFALAITVLFGLLWRPAGPVDRAPAAVAGTMALTWGDALAALIGQRFGRHRYRLWGSNRSWEGSLAMLVTAAVAMFLTLAFLPGTPLSPASHPLGAGRALLTAVLGAGAATLAEAVSPHGTDNLTVPLAATAVVLLVGY
jgi:phytol kinase